MSRSEKSSQLLKRVQQKPGARSTPSPPPASNEALKAAATPLFEAGDENTYLDLAVPSLVLMQDDEDDFEEALPVARDFKETPPRRAIGRSGLSRKEMHTKLAVLHEFGSRCIVTLMCGCLQLAHVIPVSFNGTDFRFLEWVFGDVFCSMNIHSYRNIWLVEPRMHYALDRGLIKIVPTLEVLEAIFKFSQKIREEHAGKNSNEDIGLDRKQVFPHGNYTYMIVGVLCSSEFSIPRERLVEPPEVPQAVMESNTEWEFKYQTIDYPIKVPQACDDAVIAYSEDDRLKNRVIPHHLKGYQSDRQAPFEGLYPVENRKEVMLWQDPWLVVANVGEFLFVMKSRIDERRRSDAKPGSTWKDWRVRELVKDETHVQLLDLCLTIYTFWKDDVPPRDEGTKVKASVAGPSGSGQNAPVAGPSGSGQNAPAGGGPGPSRTTRSMSKGVRSNAGAIEEPTAAPPTQPRGGKGKSTGKRKSKAGTERSVQAPKDGASRKSTRSKKGTSKV